MNEQRKDDLTREERRAFGSLAATVSGSSDLEDRVVASLHERGLVRRVSWWVRAFESVPRVPRLVAAALALIFAFTVGVEYGKRSGDAEIPEVRLETEQAPAEAVESMEDTAGAVMATADEATESEVILAVGLEKPQLATLDEGFGDFPPYPLEGRDRAISPKYR